MDWICFETFFYLQTEVLSPSWTPKHQALFKNPSNSHQESLFSALKIYIIIKASMVRWLFYLLESILNYFPAGFVQTCLQFKGRKRKENKSGSYFVLIWWIFFFCICLVVEKTYEEYGNLNYYYFSRSVLVSKDWVFVWNLYLLGIPNNADYYHALFEIWRSQWEKKDMNFWV